MPIIIKEKKHFLTRFPIWLIVIVFVTFSPLIIGLIGAWITELTTGQPCHEGNCVWMTIPWFTIVTIPIGGFAFWAYIIIIIIDSVKLFRQD